MSSFMRARNSLPAVILQPLAIASVLIGMPNTATAFDTGSVTNAELALIPRYCAYAQSFSMSNTPESKQWATRLGSESFKNIHHYCWGLINLQRAKHSSTPKGQRLFLLSTITGDIQYSIRGAAKGFVLLPEMLTRNGEVYLLRSLPDDANKSFAQARELKPDYWPAYSGWAEFLIYSGKKAEARQLVKAGLEYSPNAKVLREQYRLLGGDPSKIVARVQDHSSANAIEESPASPSIEDPNPAKAEATEAKTDRDVE